jgi:hypothetical protein
MLSGTVRDSETGLPIGNAVVSDGAYGEGNSGVTDEAGHYSYRTYCEEHTVAITAEGYNRALKILATPFLPSSDPLTLDIELEKK